MMSLLYHFVLSWSVALYAAIGLGGAGLMASWLLPALHPLRLVAKIAGVVMLAAALYLAGYQSADDRFDHERQIAAERERARLLTLERDSARRDLGAQKIAAETARRERDALAVTRGELQQKVADYEDMGRAVPKPKAGCNCGSDFVTDRELRWRRGLRKKQ